MGSNEMNISPKNVSGKCDNKCSYEYNYPETNLVATNVGLFILLTCDATSHSPVIYNSEKYNVLNITLTSPSIHLFNNNKTNAEILIEHSMYKRWSEFSSECSYRRIYKFNKSYIIFKTNNR